MPARSAGFNLTSRTSILATGATLSTRMRRVIPPSNPLSSGGVSTTPARTKWMFETAASVISPD